MLSRQVDRDRDNRLMIFDPSLYQDADFLEHIIVQPADISVFFKQRNEFGRVDHSLLRMLPADQGFGPQQAAAVRTHLGLKVNLEIMILYGNIEQVIQFMFPLQLPGYLGIDVYKRQP